MKNFLKNAARKIRHWYSPPEKPVTYWWTRFFYLKGLSAIYFIAFGAFCHQMEPLLGHNGLLPIDLWLERLFNHYAQQGEFAYYKVPSIFWFECSNWFLYFIGYSGLFLAGLVFFGYANSIILSLLWGLSMSIYHVGQVFYGYGWEMMLLEVGFLSIFLCPFRNTQCFSVKVPPSVTLMALYRWVLFRVMFGAGLIKIRGDQCWRDLTCLNFHYETQPIPNPISWYLHHMPESFHKASVFGTHIIELIVPFLLFGPRPVRHVAGVIMVGFQGMLILSGNLSWLNWLTIVICIPCFDDGFLKHFIPKKIYEKTEKKICDEPKFNNGVRKFVILALTCLIVYLSIKPTMNLISPKQKMNFSFDPLHLVNTYGAFGSVGKVRREVILQGTFDKEITSQTRWDEYEFKLKPGDVNRRPGVITPYHYRLDWQIWFAAMSRYQDQPWLVHLIYKLLQGDEDILRLLGDHPFKNKPPTFIRGVLCEYKFTTPEDKSGAWWKRKVLGLYIPPLTLDNPSLRKFLTANGLIRP